MSSSLASVPTNAIDLGRLHDSTADPSKQTTTPVDGSLLSPYSVYQPPYNNSDSPSSFTSPADLTSNGDYSDFTDFNNSDDPYYGVDFDAGENGTGVDVNILGISLPGAELPVEAYLPHSHSEATLSDDTLTNTTHSMSPNHSTTSNTNHQRNVPYDSHVQTQPSYGRVAQDPGSAMSHSHSSYNLGPSALSLHPGTSEEAANANMAHLAHSPRVTITNWGGHEQRNIDEDSDNQLGPFGESLSQDYGEMDAQGSPDYRILNAAQQPSGYSSLGASLTQGQQDFSDANEDSGRTGLDPEHRKDITDKEIPSLKDQAKTEELQIKNELVDEWRSQGGSSSDTDDGTGQQQGTLNLPPTSLRQRARSTGAVPRRGFVDPHMIAPRTSTKDPEEGKGIEPVSDLESIHENQLQEGQSYFNIQSNTINAGDWDATLQSRHWFDAPMYPYAINTQSQAPTAMEAMKKWNERADNYSLLSRTATWGTRRRRSEPSIADIESINDGSFIKRLAIKDNKEKRPSPSGYFRGSLGQLTSLVRKKSDGGKLKRNRSERENNRGRLDAPRKESQSSLTIPTARSPSSDRRRPASPRVDTNVGPSFVQGAGHNRNGSLSATSPKGPLAFIGNIRRSRSGSNMSGLAERWAESGGPPVPTLAHQATLPEQIPENDHIKIENSDLEAEDDDDEDPADDGEKMEFDNSAISFPANLAGFQEHVKRLNPNIESTYLVDRIAHQQVVRYKALLGWRVKHQGAILNSSCGSGAKCVAQGGTATLFDSSGHPREPSMSGSGLHLDLSDGDSNPEGALAPESFPPGVPVPPTSTLPAEFECQLCFRVKKFQKPSDWTKHVHEDVQPFTCTYSSCREPKSFKRKADWVRHENERHRHLEWWTCEVDDCSHKCFRKDNFLQHLVREHKLPEPKIKTKAAMKKARGGSDDQVWIMVRNCHHETTNKPQDEPCKFCGKRLTSWKKLTVHLAKHMEHISLPVLELVNKQSIDANTIISPVEPPPPRQIPLPSTPPDHKQHTNIPFGNMNASTGAYPVGQFPSPYGQTSPNVNNMSQFPNGIFQRDLLYNQTPANQTMPYSTAQQSHHGLMFDTGALGFTTFDQIGSNQSLNAQARGFGSMDHSPHIEQPHDFNPGNQHLQSPAHARSYNSYPSSHHSHHSVSPDPAAFVSGPQQMPGFQGQAIGPNPSFTSGPHQIPNYTSHQDQMIDMSDGQFGFQSLNNNPDYSHMRGMDLDHNNQSPYPQQQGQMGRGQGPTYPPSSQANYYGN